MLGRPTMVARDIMVARVTMAARFLRIKGRPLTDKIRATTSRNNKGDHYRSPLRFFVGATHHGRPYRPYPPRFSRADTDYFTTTRSCMITPSPDITNSYEPDAHPSRDTVIIPWHAGRDVTNLPVMSRSSTE